MAGWVATRWRIATSIRRAAPYGPGERNTIDLFEVDGHGPIVVFIHGGYWQALDGSPSAIARAGSMITAFRSPCRATIFAPCQRGRHH